MHALVTGAAGFVGGTLCRRLAKEGQPPRALVLPTDDARALEALGLDIVRGDVADPQVLDRAVEGCDAASSE